MDTVTLHSKTCTSCHIVIPAEFIEDMFHKNQNKPDGYHDSCMTCKLASNKDYYQRNKARIRANQTEYRKDPNVKAQMAQRKLEHNDRFRAEHGVSRTTVAVRQGKSYAVARQKLHHFTTRLRRQGFDVTSKDPIYHHCKERGWLKGIAQQYIDCVAVNEELGLDATSKRCYVVDHREPVTSFDNPADAMNPTNLRITTWQNNATKGAKFYTGETGHPLQTP